MSVTIIFDLARVILFPKDDKYKSELNALHKDLSRNPEYDFDEFFYLDTEMLDYINKLRENNELYMFTSGTIQNVPHIRKQLNALFKQIFSAQEMGVTKKSKEAYLLLARQLALPPHELIFIDDQTENVEAAQAAGIKAIKYENLNSLEAKLSELLS